MANSEFELTMQERQDQSPCTFSVQGYDGDWRELLSKKISVKGDYWIKHCGGTEVPYIEYLKVEAKANADSFERSVFSAFMNLGHGLAELECEMWDEENSKWGYCVWYKDHPNYSDPVGELGEAMNVVPRFWHAMFKTEHCGDQQWCLYSTQISRSVLNPHKTIIFRKVVFSPPPQAEAVATAQVA